MTTAMDQALQRAVESLAPPGVLVGGRLIAPGDEAALCDAEVRSMPASPLAARRASGAARLVARALLARLGYAACPIPKGASGEPIWPAGLVGSLAHDEAVAVAALARQRDVGAVGIDVEPAEPLPPDMLDLVARDEERRWIGGDLIAARCLFAAKEAVYKAAFALDRTFLEFHDIAVGLADGTAKTVHGRRFALRSCLAPRIVVVAVA